MKKRIATLLTLALSTALLLGGCGGSSDTGATNNNSDNSSGGFLSNVTSSKSDTLSEVLSTGKVIAYEVYSVDKAETPYHLYFFDNGKVAVIPGKEFGLTMGDFAKISDDEIWEKYQTVKETYGEKYIAQRMEECQSGLDELVRNKYEFVSGCIGYLPEEFIKKYEKIFWGEEVSEETIINAYNEMCSLAQQDDISEILDKSCFIDEEEKMKKAEIEELQSLLDGADNELPFEELPFAFVVFTDSSGNNVKSETMIHKVDLVGYSELNFVLGSTRQEQIYDTTYNCIDIQSNRKFLTRETMDLDKLDSKNVLIDLSRNEWYDLVNDEATSK